MLPPHFLVYILSQYLEQWMPVGGVIALGDSVPLLALPIKKKHPKQLLDHIEKQRYLHRDLC